MAARPPAKNKQMPMNQSKNLKKQDIVKEIAELWAPLTDKQLSDLSKNLNIRQYKKGELIYSDHGTPTDMMFIVSGKAKIYKDGVASGSRRQILRIVKPKEFFAFRAYFAHEQYKTNSIAFEPCVIAQLPLGFVEGLASENASVAMFIVRHLAKTLGGSDERIVNLTQKHIRGRLAESLLMLKDEYGTESSEGTVCLSMSREDLACFSNMTTSNAIRTLSAFASERLVDIDRRKITILNESELANISKIG